MLFSRSRSVVGLDIGSSAVKLVELGERKGERFLTRVGIEPLAPQAIVDGSMMDASLVVAAIQRLIDRTGVKTRFFATSLAGHSVIIKRIPVPRMEEQELAESIHWEAEQYIPFDIDDVRLDYVILPDPPGAAGRRDTMDVLLVAAKRDKVEDYVSVISQTGRTTSVVDVDVFALQNAYELAYGEAPSGVVALLNLGASVTSINVLTGGSSAFWRDISFGGNQFTERLQRQYGLSFEQAEVLKQGQAVEGYDPATVQPMLAATADELAVEIQKTFDYFAATAGAARIDHLYLTGGCALTAGLLEVFQRRFGVPVDLMNPLLQIDYDSEDFHEDWLAAVAPMLSVAVGLAARRGRS